MKNLNKFIIMNTGLTLFILLFLTAPVFSEMRTQFVPSVSITEKYTDNHLQTENNKKDEFSTAYSAGLSFGLIDKNKSMFLEYRSGYTDYASFDEEDSWTHALSLNGQSQVSKHVNLSFSENYVRDLSRTLRTNTLEKHDVNTTSAGMTYEFGPENRLGLNYTYSFDDYEDPNADAHTSHTPSASFSYWFTPQWGMNLGASYEKTEYDISSNESETWSGNIRVLKSITRHFDTYVAYAHTFTDQVSGDHTIHNPSVGFDWRPTDDSGISIGLGVLFQEWDNQNSDDSRDLFLDLDMYKTFDFSRKSTLSITGSSGYRSTSEDAASLGFEIYYRAGALFSYRVTRRLTADLNASYQVSQFDEPGLNRQDNTLGLGAGLVWAPLQWMNTRLSYSFNDFDTNAALRDDYQENMVSFTISFVPSQPVRFGASTPRATLENQLFE
ncbi:MAG: outer membrane beta-barrel protein [Proteobacteria bacterium]|nr:outer membrane beta-barrel protein [Pseudomonadota bacterium]MBU1388722.1 outer membrane beta-barrel protein [Pseudomonadota bacterium]MBU1543063.1 outer membrane beta-barrel protein [Pseudomonadota bacterium]MBU2480512.1 outer membrane beta-barrel protein [Pseudomonadota bacterium]